MQIFPLRLGASVCIWLSVLFVVIGFCYGKHSKVEVVGVGECADCKQNNIKNSHAFSGLSVTIDCKSENGHFRTRGAGKLDKTGNFKVSLPNEIVKDGEVKEECYAQFHSASAAPCPAHDGLDNSKIVFKSKNGNTHTLGPAGKLKFLSVTCASAFLVSSFKFPSLTKLPPLPPHPFLKHFGHPFPFPPIVLPPLVPIFKKPCPPKSLPPPVPVYNPPPPPEKKPCPPPVPVYNPPPPPVKKPSPPKPFPPPVPIYNPPPPPVKKPSPPKPLPPPVPIFNPPPSPVKKPSPPKPLPPPVPIYKRPPPPVKKPCPPKPSPPPVPIYNIPPPPFKKPCPPILLPPLIPIYKPPFPKILPPFPKFPPTYFPHPKYGKWPPHPPFTPHP